MIQDFELIVAFLPAEGRYCWRHRTLVHAVGNKRYWSAWEEGHGETAADCLEEVRRHQVVLQGGGRFAREQDRKRFSGRPSKPKGEDE